MTHSCIEQQIAAAWNAQADEFNQWDELDFEEKIEWAAKWGASQQSRVQGLDAETYTMSVERAGCAVSVKIPVLQLNNVRLHEQLLGVETLRLIKGVDAAIAAQAKQGGSV